MSIFQLIMLGASAFFAYKIYEHIQTLQEPQQEEQQESEEETKITRTANSFSTFDATTLLEKADEEREKGNLDRALAIYHEANIKNPKDAETVFKMAYTLSLQDRDEEALEYYLESLEYDNKNPFSYQELAKVYTKLGDEEKADEMLKKAEALA